jgi:hypothetical protein
MAIPARAVRAERGAKEVEGLAAGILNRGPCLVESEPQLGHHLLRPRQSLSPEPAWSRSRDRRRIQHPEGNFSDMITSC